ncbi:LIM and SH3 domain protein Lasp-like [Teleopsis dalmanni]|uniref:LIM and SH3 domain protein Lasp-like n=2 Tax=Teleopsis dalmanni TaxID=139649 RepID=UPI0018CE50CD|nr:LIM and SH3 domain protein Lasp-like [Teleopsis dalmanni]
MTNKFTHHLREEAFNFEEKYGDNDNENKNEIDEEDNNYAEIDVAEHEYYYITNLNDYYRQQKQHCSTQTVSSFYMESEHKQSSPTNVNQQNTTKKVTLLRNTKKFRRTELIGRTTIYRYILKNALSGCIYELVALLGNTSASIHIPKAKATAIADTPELKRIAENTKIQSNVKYHADFEKAKGKFTQVADDPETLRIKQNTKIISNVAYHGDLEKKAAMEKQRETAEIADNREESEYFSETLAAEQFSQYAPIVATTTTSMITTEPQLSPPLPPPQQQPMHLQHHHMQQQQQQQQQHHQQYMHQQQTLPPPPIQHQQYNTAAITQSSQAAAAAATTQIYNQQNHRQQQPIQQQQQTRQLQHQQYQQQQQQQQYQHYQQPQALRQQQPQTQPIKQTSHLYPTADYHQQQQQQQQHQLLQQQQQVPQSQYQQPNNSYNQLRSSILQNSHHPTGALQAVNDVNTPTYAYDQYDNNYIRASNNSSNSAVNPATVYNNNNGGLNYTTPQTQLNATLAHHSNGVISNGTTSSNGVTVVSGNPSNSNIGKIADYDPLTDGPRQIPNTGRQSTTLIYSSDSRGSGSNSAYPKRIGSVADIDPANGIYGSLTADNNITANHHQQMHHQNQQQNHQQKQQQYYQQINKMTQQPTPMPPQQQQMQQAPPQQQKSLKTSLRVYRALYDYEAQDTDEVSFREGDVIFEVDSIDSGWMTGRVERTGKIGMLPANYVEQAVI